MFGLAKAKQGIRTLNAFVGRFAAERRGVAALEFALIAPFLLSLYLVTLEVSQAIQTDTKVGRVSSMVADLLTQQDITSKAEVDGIMAIGEATLQPYNRSKPTITITAIEITDEATPKVKVVWSRKLLNGATSADAAKGTITIIPDKLKIRASFLIRVEAKLSYAPVITYTASQKTTLGLTAAFDGIAMNQTYYLKPRRSATITCSDC